MRIFRHFAGISCIALVVIISIVLWSNIQTKWRLQKLSIEKPLAISANRNSTCLTSQSGGIPTREYKKVGFYELYKKISQSNNVTLYVMSNHMWNGRLGNQMFKYAALLGITRAQGRRMFFYPNTSLAKNFKLSYVAVNESSYKWPVINQQSAFDEKLFDLPMHDVKIGGTLESFLYFAAVTGEVRQEFTFRDNIANAAAKILRDTYIKYNSSMIVGVHVRRSDFLKEKNQRLGYGVPEKSYFMKAFRLMKSKFPGRNITFLVVSDDLTWCRENLQDNDVSIMPPALDTVHLAVLSSCDHVIMSGGTFGWWGGWLANGYVIYYTGYMRKGTTYGNHFGRDEFYPRTWIGLGN